MGSAHQKNFKIFGQNFPKSELKAFLACSYKSFPVKIVMFSEKFMVFSGLYVVFREIGKSFCQAEKKIIKKVNHFLANPHREEKPISACEQLMLRIALFRFEILSVDAFKSDFKWINLNKI